AAGRTWLAAVLIAGLSIKPHLAVLIPVALIAAGDWRLILRAAVTTAAAVAIPCAIFGLESWQLALAHLDGTRVTFAEGDTLAQMVTPFAGALVLGLPA
ncbi:MAG: DUF2029 domain-containing protein, partial [Rhodobacteraceae bacterium]|nr:DUF2029 domain-containing protein [Paracoccaceae bacterium]